MPFRAERLDSGILLGSYPLLGGEHTRVGGLVAGVVAEAKMTPMVKTQVELHEAELAVLHRLATAKKRRVADLVREAIGEKYLRSVCDGPVGLWAGELKGSSSAHDGAFDEP